MKTRLIPLICLLNMGCASVDAPKELLGAYQFEDGRTASIRPSEGRSLRYRIYESGDTGRLYRKSENIYESGAGFARREPVELVVKFHAEETGSARELEFRYQDGTTQRAKRIGREHEVNFISDGVRLFGRLHFPDRPPPYPAVVLVHGSGDSPGTLWMYNSDFFVANGFAVLTYDKRGSGQSEGSFTFDFRQLARDAVAAVDYLASVPEVKTDSIGLSAYSQGGWVAPLAATLSDRTQFVVVNYGMIESPAEEARLEMRQLLLNANVTGADLQAADELIRAAVDLVASGLESGWPRFQELKKKYRKAPWIDNLDGTPVAQLMSLPRVLVQWIGKRKLPPGLDWNYDSTKLLESSEIPMVWLLAEEDLSAPNTETIAKLRSLAVAGKPYRLILFPNADHGMLTFEETGEGRNYTGYAPGYFKAEVEAAIHLASHESSRVLRRSSVRAAAHRHDSVRESRRRRACRARQDVAPARHPCGRFR